MKTRTPVKQKLLFVLKKDTACTIKTIMEHFSVTEVAVRRHLHELINQGFVKENIHKQDIGRPYHTYELTGKGHRTFPNQYEQLPVELLKDLEGLQGPEAVEELLDKRMEREEEYYQSQLSTGDFDQKIEEIAQLQNEKGYMIEYEKNADGDYIIKNYNCPIMNLAHSYNHVCGNEKKVFAKLFKNSEVISEQNITAGDHCCKWIITKPIE
ncbi:helix-turn-helix transcriptional regulator [Virgibacillus sp. W0181]|uniref:helix-turn-helix transcriptional regulator n=1 Tax=Virgibacillus sp. W0181 TaxID=3391581 RepID=UPI003F47BC7E